MLLAQQLCVIGCSQQPKRNADGICLLCSQKDEPDAFKELGTGNRIATWLFYVSDTFLPSVTVYSIPWNYFILLFFHSFLLKGLASEANTNFGVIHIGGGRLLTQTLWFFHVT